MHLVFNSHAKNHRFVLKSKECSGVYSWLRWCAEFFYYLCPSETCHADHFYVLMLTSINN